MMSRAKYWMGMNKPKSQHSLDNLKYLYTVLNKNQNVTENNTTLLIETLRSNTFSFKNIFKIMEYIFTFI